MTQVTVEEPKSIVEEVTKYECDNCHAVVDEDSINRQKITPETSRGFKHKYKKEAHLCDACVEADEYISYVESVEQNKSLAEMISSKVNLVVNLFSFALGSLIVSPIFPVITSFDLLEAEGEVLLQATATYFSVLIVGFFTYFLLSVWLSKGLAVRI